MTLDKATRNTLRSAVTQCRRLLEESVGDLLEGQYGIHRDGRAEDEAAMSHLPLDLREYRAQVLAGLDHIRARVIKPADAVPVLIREAAYTHLNRLCAYKMLEQRKLIREAVGRGSNSTGFKFYLAEHPEDEHLWSTGRQDVAYCHFLNWRGESLSAEIGALFSPDDPANRLFPPQRVLDQVLAIINGEELRDVWDEEETIGWVYQYFTPKELRDKARKESSAPRNADELAFRNQFYTPRYVVEFLTENTLGRTWYEMRQGRTSLAESCRYMVRRPDEVFLSLEDRWDSRSPDSAFLCGRSNSLAAFDVPIGEWHGGEKANGVITMPWSDVGAAGERLIRFAHSVRPFPWVNNSRMEGWQLLPERLSSGEPTDPVEGSTQDLWDLLLALSRADRFNEGTVATNALAMTRIANEIRRRLLVARDPHASQEERLRAPHLVAYRSPKDPRELRILDPACGSGHFLLYAFDLLLTIYREAWDDPASPPFSGTGRTLRQDFPDASVFAAAVPGLILRHNLHGIDIDLRAVQIAQLVLWLRSQRAYADLGIRPTDRPRITRINVVAAEPLPGERDLLAEFERTLDPPVLAELVSGVWEGMAGIGEIGSLLKVEDLVRHVVADAKRDWQSGRVFDQVTLFSADAPPRQERLDFSFISDEAFWQDAERRVKEALRRYAESVDGDRYQRRLFADDAAQGFAFLELFDAPFDAVLMNPPFGAISQGARAYVERHYPKSKHDLYAAFVEHGLELLRPCGYLGAITSRTGFFLTTFQNWREEVILDGSRIHTVADLGQGVLDTAMVETAAYALEKRCGP